MHKNFNSHRKVYGVLGAVVAMAIAVNYLIFTPAETLMVDGLQRVILVYGHSMCWILLSAACISWVVAKSSSWSKILAYAALLTYIIFISTYVVTKFI